MFFGLEQEDGSFITPMGLALPLLPLEAGRGISAETCGLEDVFLPDDLGSGPYIMYYNCILSNMQDPG